MVTIISILILAGGCGNSTEVTEKNLHFVLSVNRDTVTESQEAKGICKIRSFRTTSPFETNYLIYKINDYSYESDFYNRYLVSPSSMISEQALNWLTDSGVFEYVVDDNSRADAQYLLEGKITGMYADFTNPVNLSSVIEIKFIMIEIQSYNNSIIFDKSYHAATELESSNAADIIKGMNGSLEKVLMSLEEDLRKI